MESDREMRLRRLEERYSESPVHGLLELSLSIPEAGRAEVQIRGSKGIGNRSGNVAGGIIALMLDSAVVQACRSKQVHDGAVSTVEAKVNFLRPVAADTALTAIGSVDFMGGTLAVGTGKVIDEHGDVVAIGIVTMRLHGDLRQRR